jgi:acyl-CoA thioesterase I
VGLLDNRLVRRMRPGIAATLDCVEPFRAAWESSNAAALTGTGPLWLVLGDSSAQGIGAPSPDRGYVGQLRTRLEERDGGPWRVLNVSRSGARLRQVIANQLDWIDQLPASPELVTCAAGANDITWRPSLRAIRHDLDTLLDRLPAGAVIATLPQGLSRRRAAVLNAVIRTRAAGTGLVVADVWAHTGAPWAGTLASDHFHPSERGYRNWADAFAAALRLDGTKPGPSGPDA